MKRLCFPVFCTLFWIFLIAPTMVFANSNENAIAVFKKSSAVQPYFSDAYGYVVFPTVFKGGAIVGGASGKGKVFVGDVATGTATLNQISLGFQFGVQVFSEIVFFQDERAFREFEKGGLELDANASVVLITAAAQAKAGTMGTTAGASAGPATGAQASNRYRKGMAVFVHTKGGLMLEAVGCTQQIIYEPYEKAWQDGKEEQGN